MEEAGERFYTMREACSRLGIHPNTLRRWDKEGKIKTVRPERGQRRIPESEIKHLLDKSKEEEDQRRPRGPVMPAGRPITALVGKDKNGIPMLESDKLIVFKLQQGQMTFGGLLEKTRLSSSTLAEHLKKLETLGYLDRRGDQRVYKLSGAFNPAWRTVQNIAVAASPVSLDVQEGRKPLTNEVVKVLLKFLAINKALDFEKFDLHSSEEQREKLRELFKGQGEKLREEEIDKLLKEGGGAVFTYWDEIEKRELNEALFITALARYHLEAHYLRKLAETEKPLEHLDEYDPIRQIFLEHAERCSWDPNKLFKTFYEKEHDNPEVFPALGVAKPNMEKCDALLEWISPCVFRLPAEGLDERGCWVPSELEHAVAPGLIASTFKMAQNDYARILAHVWESILKTRYGGKIEEVHTLYEFR
jgi:excisionase family DNA binding protein